MKIQEQIRLKLTEALSPLHLEVVNESHAHSVAPGSETHFKVTIVSKTFQNQSRVERQRKVYALLQNEMQNGVHALAMHTLTPEEFESKKNPSPNSPVCQGGSKE